MRPAARRRPHYYLYLFCIMRYAPGPIDSAQAGSIINSVLAVCLRGCAFRLPYQLMRSYRTQPMWQDWVNGILGLWIILIPFVGADSMTVLVVTGIIIAVLGFWAAASGGKPKPPAAM